MYCIMIALRFKQFNIPKAALVPYNRPLRMFMNHVILSKGVVELPTDFGEKGNSMRCIVPFLVVVYLCHIM